MFYFGVEWNFWSFRINHIMKIFLCRNKESSVLLNMNIIKCGSFCVTNFIFHRTEKRKKKHSICKNVKKPISVCLHKNISLLMRIFSVRAKKSAINYCLPVPNKIMQFFAEKDLVGKMLDYLTYLSESQTGIL